MDERLKQELFDSLRNSEYCGLVAVEFQGNLAECRKLTGDRISFEKAVGALAEMWQKTSERHGWEVKPFGGGYNGRNLKNGSLGIFFSRKNAEVVKIAPDQNYKHIKLQRKGIVK